MNWDEIQGNWRVFKGRVRERWGKLTDDDLDRIDGKYEQLIGTLQARYGWAREQLEHEVDEFCAACSCEPAAKHRSDI
jgi:uncharacterized protein YjbJ (UPF0337 family)